MDAIFIFVVVFRYFNLTQMLEVIDRLYYDLLLPSVNEIQRCPVCTLLWY